MYPVEPHGVERRSPSPRTRAWPRSHSLMCHGWAAPAADSDGAETQSTFSGLMSRWTMWSEWRRSTAERSWRTIATASASVNCARSAMWSMSSPPSAGSEKMNIHLPSRWWPRYRTMCSCSPASAHSWHSLSYCRIAHALIRSVSSTFTATRSPDSDSASYTQPNAPAAEHAASELVLDAPEDDRLARVEASVHSKVVPAHTGRAGGRHADGERPTLRRARGASLGKPIRTAPVLDLRATCNANPSEYNCVT